MNSAFGKYSSLIWSIFLFLCFQSLVRSRILTAVPWKRKCRITSSAFPMEKGTQTGFMMSEEQGLLNWLMNTDFILSQDLKFG